MYVFFLLGLIRSLHWTFFTIRKYVNLGFQCKRIYWPFYSPTSGYVHLSNSCRSPVEFWPSFFAESMSPCHHLLPIIWSANSSRSHNKAFGNDFVVNWLWRWILAWKGIPIFQCLSFLSFSLALVFLTPITSGSSSQSLVIRCVFMYESNGPKRPSSWMLLFSLILIAHDYLLKCPEWDILAFWCRRQYSLPGAQYCRRALHSRSGICSRGGGLEGSTWIRGLTHRDIERAEVRYRIVERPDERRGQEGYCTRQRFSEIERKLVCCQLGDWFDAWSDSVRTEWITRPTDKESGGTYKAFSFLARRQTWSRQWSHHTTSSGFDGSSAKPASQCTSRPWWTFPENLNPEKPSTIWRSSIQNSSAIHIPKHNTQHPKIKLNPHLFLWNFLLRP